MIGELLFFLYFNKNISQIQFAVWRVNLRNKHH